MSNFFKRTKRALEENEWDKQKIKSMGTKLVWGLENDFKRFPLPICFESGAERREMYRRHLHIQELVKRYLQINKNRINEIQPQEDTM